MDIAATVCAHRHCRNPVVTVGMDEIFFHSPIKVGDFVILEARINYTGRTSMEVEVKVICEDPKTGGTTHTNNAFLTFVSVDENGKPRPVPPLKITTEQEKQSFKEAKARRKVRLQHMQAKKIA